jgi:hypothetical protein
LFGGFGDIDFFQNEEATQQLLTTLQQKNSTVQRLIHFGEFRDVIGAATIASINNSMKCNEQMNHRVNVLLLAPSHPAATRPGSQIATRTLMMLKTWHNKAITKFAIVLNNIGASAIFKLFTARPQLLENRLQRLLRLRRWLRLRLWQRRSSLFRSLVKRTTRLFVKPHRHYQCRPRSPTPLHVHVLLCNQPSDSACNEIMHALERIFIL